VGWVLEGGEHVYLSPVSWLGAGDSVGPEAVAVVCLVLLDYVDGPW
jgi:hypothetical protein